MNAHRLLTLAAAGLVAAGCTVGPDYRRPEVAAPAEFRRPTPAAPAAAHGPTEATSLADRAWWEVVDDPALERLIEQALESSYDLRLAAWRVEEARAQAGVTRSERFPAVQGSAGVSRGRSSAFASPFTATAETYDVRLGVSWELDLWGRIRRANEAALAEVLASEEGRRGVVLTLVSEVASGYFRLRALDLQLEIAQRTAVAFGATHSLFRERLDAGLASALETSSASASLAATNAAIPELERRIVEQENRLAFLVGRPPGEIERGEALVDQLLPPAIPAGLPSALLERRPDLRGAEQELVAANAAVGVAKADYFPRISLTGAFGGLATDVSDLFGDGETWSIGGGLLTPVLQGSRLRDRHRAALARWEQAKARYERSVTNAFVEVSTALVAYEKLAEVEHERARAVAEYRDAAEIANSRYLSGLSDYLDVLQAQQQLFPAENALAEVRFERLATLVGLYRALGGGWQLADDDWRGERLAEARISPPPVGRRATDRDQQQGDQGRSE